METDKPIEALRTEYYVAQLAMRSIDQTIMELTQELARWSGLCHTIISQAFEQGERI